MQSRLLKISALLLAVLICVDGAEANIANHGGIRLVDLTVEHTTSFGTVWEKPHRTCIVNDVNCA